MNEDNLDTTQRQLTMNEDTLIAEIERTEATEPPADSDDDDEYDDNYSYDDGVYIGEATIL